MVWIAAFVALSVVGCAPQDQTQERTTGEGLGLAFEDQLRPDIVSLSGNGLRDPDTTAPAGLWGVVSGLNRGERALVANAANGQSVTVSLFRGTTGSPEAIIRLSPDAADALGILDDPVPVQVTAVRREPVLIQ